MCEKLLEANEQGNSLILSQVNKSQSKELYDLAQKIRDPKWKGRGNLSNTRDMEKAQTTAKDISGRSASN